MLTKDFKFELKDVASDGTFEGLASTFGKTVKDRDLKRDVVLHGAFKRTLKSQPSFPMLWNHNMWSPPIGVFDSADMEETTKGLKVKGQIEIEVSEFGRQIHALLKMRAVNSLSIGYTVPDGKARFDGDTRFLSEIKLWEISPVTFPAQPKAKITRVKSEQLAYAIKSLERAQVDQSDEAKAEAAAAIEQTLALLQATEVERDSGLDADSLETEAPAGPADQSGDSEDVDLDSLAEAMNRIHRSLQS